MLFLVRLAIVLILMLDRCTICAECTIGLKSFWMHPMELLDDVAHGESCFGPLRDGVSFGSRWVHGLPQTYHRLRNYF
jgi:hypothetical protein